MQKKIVLLSLAACLSFAPNWYAFSQGTYSLNDVTLLATGACLTKKNVPVNGLVEEYDDYGNVIFSVTCAEGKKEGTEVGYWGNGQIRWQADYHGGKLHGQEEWFYPNGQRASEYAYQNGKKDGSQVEYYATGAVKLESSYANGQKEGIETTYYPNGRVESQVRYKNNTAIPVTSFPTVID